jgi:hypothetical protein
MGEASTRSRSRAAILANEPRCIYCGDPHSTLEHMPPRSMFVLKRRPSGFEFAACTECNRATSPADLVASFFARLNQSYRGDRRLIAEAADRKRKLIELAPGLLEEFFRPNKRQRVWGRDGLVATPLVQINADGPLTKAYLTVFAAKLGMALFREHVGHALPLNGAVYTKYFLNAGISRDTAEGMLRIMPIGGTLRQGTFQVPEQFAYRYNCDGGSIIAALAGFHSNLHILTIATSRPDFFKLPDAAIPHVDTVRPGELVARIPQKIRGQMLSSLSARFHRTL